MTSRPWTTGERRILIDLASKPDLTWVAIGAQLNRAPSSCHGFYKAECKRQGITPRERTRGYKAAVKARQLSPEEIGSVMLFEAVQNLICRLAARTGESREAVLRKQLGERQLSPVPGTEVFFKTSAMRKLAA